MMRSRTADDQNGKGDIRHAASRVAAVLSAGAAVIDSMNPADYSRGESGRGSIGAHIRHNLDFVECFIRGVSTGLIDYSARERLSKIETDPKAAVEKLRLLAASLDDMAVPENKKISVRSEAEPETVYGSTVGRELEFLHSHTIHHYALIAEKMRAFGVETQEGFGVAPSTIRYWKGEAAGRG